METLYKLYIVRELLDEYHVLIPDDIPNYAKESLCLFPEVKTYSVPKRTGVFFKFAAFIENFKSGYYSDCDMIGYSKFLIHRARNVLYRREIKCSEIIFVNRRKEHGRHIVNAHKIEELIDGVSVIDNETMTVCEQILFYANSNVLIGMHGAALSNMVFMKKDSLIIEYSSKRYLHNRCYENLAKRCSHRYVSLILEELTDDKYTLNQSSIDETIKLI
jgi:capsular polysaccharide biosynthesis protein